MAITDWFDDTCCSYLRNKDPVNKSKIHPDVWCKCERKHCDKGFTKKDSPKSAKVGSRFFHFCSERCYYTWLYKQ